MKNPLLLFFLTLISACKASESSSESTGVFYNSSKERTYELQLLAEHRFILEIKSRPHSFSKCSGVWRKESDGLIMLFCFEEPVESQLSSAYMFKRVWEVKALSKNRIRLGEVVLNRK